MPPSPSSSGSPSAFASSFPHLDTTSILLSSPPQLDLPELDGPDSSSRPVSLGLLSYYTGSPESSAYLARLPSTFPTPPLEQHETTRRAQTQADEEAEVGTRWDDTHGTYQKVRGEMGAEASLSSPASLKPRRIESKPQPLSPASAPAPASQSRMTGRQAAEHEEAADEDEDVPPPLPPKPYTSVPSPTTSTYTTHTHHTTHTNRTNHTNRTHHTNRTNHTSHTHHTYHTNHTHHTAHTQHSAQPSHPQYHLDPLPTPYSVRSFSALSHSSSSSDIGATFPRAQIARMASAAQIRELGSAVRGAGLGYSYEGGHAVTLDAEGSGSGLGARRLLASSRIGDQSRGVTSAETSEDQKEQENIVETKVTKERGEDGSKAYDQVKPLPARPKERFSVADTFANPASTSTSTGGRVAGLGLGLNIRPSVEVDPERIDLALGSLPWPELPFRDPASPGSPLPPSSAVSAPAGGSRLQMEGTDAGKGKGGTHRSESASAIAHGSASAIAHGSGGGGGSARGSASESKGGSASRGFWARKAKIGGIFATLQGELIGTPGKDKERVQEEDTGRSAMKMHSAQRDDWKRDDRAGPGQAQGHGLGLGVGLGADSGSAFGRSSTLSTFTSTSTTRPEPRSRGREKDLPIPTLPAYSFLSSDPLPEGLPSAISSDRGGSRSQSRLSSRSSTSISTAGASFSAGAGAGASQGLSLNRSHSQSSLGRSFSHTRSFSRGNKPAPSPLSLGFLPQHDGKDQDGIQEQDEDEFHRFAGLRTADGSSTSASSQTSPWSLSRDPSELDDRRLSVPYSPTLAHGASLDWQRPYPPEVVPGIPPVGDNFNPYDREDEYRFSGMSFPVDRPGSGSAWSGMADIETVPTSRDVSRGSRISWATSANHDHARNSDRERDRDRANPSRNKSTKSIRSAKSFKSTKSIRSKRISTTSTSTSHRPYGSRRWEIARGEDGEGVALVGRGGGDWGGAGAEEEMELGALVGRAAVLERLLRQGKRVSRVCRLFNDALRVCNRDWRVRWLAGQLRGCRERAIERTDASLCRCAGVGAGVGIRAQLLLPLHRSMMDSRFERHSEDVQIVRRLTRRLEAGAS